MSHIKAPKNMSEQDQTKGYHITDAPEFNNIGKICGTLSMTGERVDYGYFYCHALYCNNCGKFVDTGDWDKVWFGKDSGDLGLTW